MAAIKTNSKGGKRPKLSPTRISDPSQPPEEVDSEGSASKRAASFWMKQINEDKTATDVGRKSPTKVKDLFKVKQSLIGNFYKKSPKLD